MNPCVAHRGWSGLAPENTVTAIRLAAEDQDIEMIEIDVQLSKDGVPVVIHDFVLGRTANGSGNVKDHTLAELTRLDAGSWFAPRFAGETIPTLQQVLNLVKGKKRLNIELKQAGDLYPLLEETVIRLIRNNEMQNEVIVTSFDHRAIKKVKELAPELETGLIVLGHPVLLSEQLKAAGASFLSLEYHYLTDSLVQDMHEQRIEIIAWTVNAKQDMEWVADFGSSVKICTNHPEIWKQIRSEKVASM